MSPQAAYTMHQTPSTRELGSTGELRPGLRYVRPAIEQKASTAPATARLWMLAVALAIGAAALRVFY